MSGLAVRRLTMDDKARFPGALELLNRTQGRDLFRPEYLDQRTESPTSYVAAAFDGDELVGLGDSEIITNYDYYLPFEPKIYEQLGDRKVGSFSTLAIVETRQGRGIGQAISHDRLTWLKAQCCHVVLGVSWVSGLPHTSNRVFEKLGFRAVRRVGDFYHASSLKEPFVCPGCGDPPCTCAAILYRLELDGSPAQSR